MLEKLDVLVRFWALSGRLARAAEPLDASERRELLALLAMVGNDVEIPAPGTVKRKEAPLPAQIFAEGGVSRGEILRVTAGALVLSSADLIPVGREVLIRVTDAVAGVEYVLPCRVVWQAKGAPSTMALVVDGIPNRQRFQGFPMVQPSLGLAPARRLVG